MRFISPALVAALFVVAGCSANTPEIAELLVLCDPMADDSCDGLESCDAVERDVYSCTTSECGGEFECDDGYLCVEGACRRERGDDGGGTGDEPGGDEPGGDEPGGDEPGGDEPGGDEPGGDEPGGDEPGGDEPGGDEPGAGCEDLAARCEAGGADACEVYERECAGEPGGDEPGGDEPGGDEPGGDEPGGDEPGGDEPGGDEPPAEEPPAAGCEDLAAACEEGNAEACEAHARECA